MVFRLPLLGAAALACATSAVGQASDPPSATIDPPPGVMDYIGTMPAGKWTFGKLLWQGQQACSQDSCEAAYNANPLFVLVQRQRNCCEDHGYSVAVTVRARDCQSVSYYLAFSKDLDRLSQDQRSSLVARKIGQLTKGVESACQLASTTIVPTEAVASLGLDPDTNGS